AGESEPDPVQQARQRRLRPARVAQKPEPVLRAKPGIAIVNRGSDLRFERLLVRGWNGRLPVASDTEGGVVVTAKGHISWRTVAFDAGTGEIVSSDGEQETRTPLAEVTSLTFPFSKAE